MALAPLYPEGTSKRPLSYGIQGWKSKFHPLLSVQGQTRIRAHFSIGDWLLMGSCLQAFILLLTPLPLLYALTPTLALAIYKITKTILVINGAMENKHMKGVRVGRTVAVFPEENGTFDRPIGSTVGGEGMCVILLSTKSNHPLGMFNPPFQAMSNYARKMYRELESNAEEFGFLGFSDYSSHDVLTKPTTMSIMYFKNLEGLHKFARSRTHTEGMEWWSKAAASGEVDSVTISHEVYSVPEGKWENVYDNARNFDFAATAHAIQTDGGEKKWMCPALNANKSLKTSAARMGTVKK